MLLPNFLIIYDLVEYKICNLNSSICNIEILFDSQKKNEDAKIDTNQLINQHQQSLPNCQSSVLSNPWQNLSASSSSVVDYLSQLPTTSLPISLHDFLKYSAETLKKDTVGQHGAVQQHNGEPNLNIGNNGNSKKLENRERHEEKLILNNFEDFFRHGKY